jgi:hypothetical protein
MGRRRISATPKNASRSHRVADARSGHPSPSERCIRLEHRIFCGSHLLLLSWNWDCGVRPTKEAGVIADVPRVKLSELVGRFGIGLSGDARRSKALLADVCGDGFRGECAVLVAAVEEGVAGELLTSSSGLPTEVLLGRLSDRLQANRGVSSDLARWGVESWAVALGVVAGGNTLATFKMDGLRALIDVAGADGTISNAALNRLLLEAKTRGVSEADARAYLSAYAAAHGWQLGKAQRRSRSAKAGLQPPPPPQPQPVNPGSPAMHGFWAILVIAGFIGGLSLLIFVANRESSTPAYQPQQPTSPGTPSPAAPASAPPPASEPSSSSPAPQQKQPPHVGRDAQGRYYPEDGYAWSSSATDDLNVLWKPGRFSLKYPNIVAAEIEGIWRPADGYTWQDGSVGGRVSDEDLSVKPVENGALSSPPVSPSPAPPASAYAQGLADRAAWERWYGGLSSGDFQRGAYWWSGQRNHLRGPCDGVESAGNAKFIEGCNVAKAFFGRELEYRQLPTDNPNRVQYLAGWNAETAPAGAPQQDTASPPVSPSPAPPASTYEQGMADRAAWERWYGGLSSADFQRGAYWWAGQRNHQRGPCNGAEAAGNDQFIEGCNAAKVFFEREYQYRQLLTDNPDRVQYLAGWNAETGDAQQKSDTPAEQLNSQELKRLRER